MKIWTILDNNNVELAKFFLAGELSKRRPGLAGRKYEKMNIDVKVLNSNEFPIPGSFL